jgi:hypothetical protein
MKLAAIVAAVVVLLYLIHRLASWMEDRGWIYYRKGHGSSASLGSAFLEVQSMFEPGRKHEIEVRQAEDLEEEEAGDPPVKPSKRKAEMNGVSC